MRYWKPWHPPLSTLTRKARLGLLSPVDIFCRRFDARGAIDINMGLPESSVRGFWIACAGFAVGASADVARDLCGVCRADEKAMCLRDIGL